jgi:cell wall-associated NlpC family hydrolase
VPARLVLVALLALALTSAALAAAWPGADAGDGGDAATASAAPASAPASVSAEDEAAAGAPAPEEPPLRRRTPQVVEPLAGQSAEDAAASAQAAKAVETTVQDTDVTPAPAPPARLQDGGGGTQSVTRAEVLDNGIALPPIDAPQEVRQIIEAGNQIARSPYLWGGGHGKWLDKGYDCSGSVSYALAAAGLLNAPLASGPLMTWGKAGKGKWVTIYTNPGHVWLDVAGVRFDTIARKKTGSRWLDESVSTSGYVARHPPGL